MPVEPDFDAMVVEAPDAEKLSAVFESLEFRTLARRVLGDAVTPAAAPAAGKSAPASVAGGDAQMDMFGGGGDANRGRSGGRTSVGGPGGGGLSDGGHPGGRAELIGLITAADRFAFDTETTGLDARTARLVGMSFSLGEGTGWYVPVPLGAPNPPIRG